MSVASSRSFILCQALTAVESRCTPGPPVDATQQQGLRCAGGVQIRCHGSTLMATRARSHPHAIDRCVSAELPESWWASSALLDNLRRSSENEQVSLPFGMSQLRSALRMADYFVDIHISTTPKANCCVSQALCDLPGLQVRTQFHCESDSRSHLSGLLCSSSAPSLKCNLSRSSGHGVDTI